MFHKTVDIEVASDIKGDYNVGCIEAGEWLEYSVIVDSTSDYQILLRIASNISGGQVKVDLDSVTIIPNMFISSTGGWQNWESMDSNPANYPSWLAESSTLAMVLSLLLIGRSE